MASTARAVNRSGACSIQLHAREYRTVQGFTSHLKGVKNEWNNNVII